MTEPFGNRVDRRSLIEQPGSVCHAEIMKADGKARIFLRTTVEVLGDAVRVRGGALAGRRGRRKSAGPRRIRTRLRSTSTPCGALATSR